MASEKEVEINLIEGEEAVEIKTTETVVSVSTKKITVDDLITKRDQLIKSRDMDAESFKTALANKDQEIAEIDELIKQVQQRKDEKK